MNLYNVASKRTYRVSTDVQCTAFVRGLGNKRCGFGILKRRKGTRAIELPQIRGHVDGQLRSTDQRCHNGPCVARSVDRLLWGCLDLVIEILDVSVPNRTPMVLGQFLRRFSREIVEGCSPCSGLPSFLVSGFHRPPLAGHPFAILGPPSCPS